LAATWQPSSAATGVSFGAAASFLLRSGRAFCYSGSKATKREARDVDLALRLNVLAVFASFLLIGAILLGAF